MFLFVVVFLIVWIVSVTLNNRDEVDPEKNLR